MGEGVELVELLEVWRETKNVEVANAIDALSRRITRFLRPIATSQKTEVTRKWVKIASEADPADLGRLLDRSITRVVGARDAFVRRIEDLQKWPSDPRIAAYFGELLVDPPPPLLDFHALSKEIVSSIARLGDPRSLATVKFVRARTWRFLGTSELEGHLEEAIARLERAPMRELDEAMTKRVRAILEESAEERIEREHLEAIAASPDDDEVRLVYADWLQSKGDARGELMALQCAIAKGTADRLAHDRVRKLLVWNRDVWVGELARIVDRHQAVFSRGFVVKCRTNASAGPHVVERIARDRGWWFVRELAIRSQQSADTASLLASDLRSLRKLVIEHPLIGEPFAHASFPRLETLVLVSGLDEPARFVLAQGEQFPALKTLAVRDHVRTYAWLANAPITNRLALLSVFVGNDVGSLAATVRLFPKELRALELTTANARYLFTRSADGEFDTCSVIASASVRSVVQTRVAQWVMALTTLPSTLRHFKMALTRGPMTPSERTLLSDVLSTYRSLQTCELPESDVVHRPPPLRDHEVPRDRD